MLGEPVCVPVSVGGWGWFGLYGMPVGLPALAMLGLCSAVCTHSFNPHSDATLARWCRGEKENAQATNIGHALKE